jgi:uroporphyrin-III C-methyltransferase
MSGSVFERGTTEAEVPRVFLVGAGPGDPELLTVKALRLLQRADVVLHDALIGPQILALAPHARLIDVGKRAGRGATAQRFIHRLLVASAQRHACVVRLKGGDPTLFGRLDEEIQALRAAGVAFEIVPGVTAACAAAAGLGVSLTLRGVARGVRFATPRIGTGEPEAAHATDPTDTLVVYMAGQVLDTLALRLMDEGRPADTPLVVIENVSLPTEHRWTGTLGTAAAWSADWPCTVGRRQPSGRQPGTRGRVIGLIPAGAGFSRHA